MYCKLICAMLYYNSIIIIKEENMGNGILSVGIDIGTSTTQVIFSRIEMENTASFFAVPHISIVDKEVIYKKE